MSQTTPPPDAAKDSLPVPTPRTDAMVSGNSDPSQDEYEDLAGFARQLERELIEATTLIAQLTKAQLSHSTQLAEAATQPAPHDAALRFNLLVHENATLVDQKLQLENAAKQLGLELRDWRSITQAIIGLKQQLALLPIAATKPDAADADRRRLDWLEKNGALVNNVQGGHVSIINRRDERGVAGANEGDISHYFGDSYRQAIDKAMARDAGRGTRGAGYEPRTTRRENRPRRRFHRRRALLRRRHPATPG